MNNGHLSIEQIERLSQQESQSSRHQNSGDWSHVENCNRCRNLVEKCRSINAKLGELVSAHLPGRSDMNCPEHSTWFEVSAGALPDEESLQYLEHAAICESCAKKLRTAVQVWEEEISPEDEKFLQSLPGPRIFDKGASLERLTSNSNPVNSEKTNNTTRKSRWKLWHLSFIAAPLAAVAALVFGFWPRMDPALRTERLLQTAYTEDRTLELRFPNARYARLQTLKSGGSNPLSNSAIDLGKAANEIASGLQKHPEDPKWIMLQAQLDVLHWNYQQAVVALDKLNSSSADTLLIRGLALYEKAEREHDGSSYGIAQDILGEVLQKDPNNTVALFNRAIICKKNQMFKCASNDLERFLSIEKDQGWITEAQEILRQIKEKKTSIP